MHNYGDHRDTQRRYMHRAAPLRPEGFESRIFAEGERHDPAEGWTHDPAHAVALGKEPVKTHEPKREPERQQAPDADPVDNVPVPDTEDESEEIPFEAQLAALKRPALLKLAQELGVPFETGWTAAELRRAIITSRG